MLNWPRATIFDFDGVLVNSEPLHFRALHSVLSEQSLEISESWYYRDLLGMTDRDTFAYVFRKHQKPLPVNQLAALVERKSDMMLQLIAAGEMKLLDGAEDFVRSLQPRCPLAICSGSRRVEIELALENAGLRDYFAHIVSADDFAVGKPDPAIYLHTLAQLSADARIYLPPQQCLVIEDSPTVVEHLRPAGFRILAITSSVAAEQFPLADWVCKDLRSAPALRARDSA